MKTCRIENYPGLVIHETELLRRGADMILPPHLFVASDYREFYDEAILQHAYGHFLQYQKYGFLKFYFSIAPRSILGALRRDNYAAPEIEANRLAHEFFGPLSLMGSKFFPLQKE